MTAPEASARNLILIGARASGKTTLGRELAKRLGLAFSDLDDLLAARVNQSAESYLADQGEAAFREQERACLREAAALRGSVVATGGGAVLHEAALRDLAATGRVVYLAAELETLLQRQQAAPRTRLRSGSLESEIRQLLQERKSLYEAHADITVPVEGADPILRLVTHLGEG